MDSFNASSVDGENLTNTVTPLAVNERIASQLLSVSVAALRRWRRERRGPRFVRLSRCVRYRVADLEAFVNEGVHGGSREVSSETSVGAR